MMFWYGQNWPFWEVAAMWIAMVAFWAVVAWAVYALLAALLRRGRQPTTEEQDALAALEQRLARGEIDAERYERVASLLAPHRGSVRRARMEGRGKAA